MLRLAAIAYVVIGVIVASQHSYYAHLATLSHALSAVAATALWPLVFLGANLHLSLATGDVVRVGTNQPGLAG